MDRSADNLGQTISNIQRDLEELKSNQGNGSGGGGGGGGGEEYFAGNGINIDQSNTISVDTSVVATQTDLASKQDALTAGSHISISNNTISATGIPTKTSDLTNDSNFSSMEVVESLPAIGSDDTLYFVEASDLPTGYERLSYINIPFKSPTTAYVALENIWTTTNWKMEFDFEVAQCYDYCAIFGRIDDTDQDREIWINSSSIYRWRAFGYTGSTDNSFFGETVATHKRYVVSHDNLGTSFVTTVNGNQTLSRAKLTGTATSSMSFAFGHREGGGQLYGKIYGYKAWDGNGIVENLVPAKRTSDDALGFYDIANGTFKAMQGSGVSQLTGGDYNSYGYDSYIWDGSAYQQVGERVYFTSQLVNDSGFLTSVSWDDVQNKPTFATVATTGDYDDLTNKPTIPTVNNGTLTIQKNGTTVRTFTANQSTAATANITVPTKTSDVTNDSGFITYSSDNICGSGTSISMPTPANSALASFQLDGETSQNGTPTPSAPVAVNTTTGENVVKICGNNLLKVASGSATRNQSTITISNGDINYTASASGASYAAFGIDGSSIRDTNYGDYVAWGGSKLGPGTYTLSVRYISGSTTTVAGSGGNFLDIFVYGREVGSTGRVSTQLAKASVNTADQTATFTLTEEKEVNIVAYMYANSPSVNINFNVQLELGSTATAYEPYQDQSYPISLGTLELCKIGDYQDYIYKSGDKWYVRKEVGKYQLDGTINWYVNGTNNYQCTRSGNNKLYLATSATGLSNYFNVSNSSTGINMYPITQTGTDYIRITNAASEWASTDLFKTFLINNAVYLYYPLAESAQTDTEITNATLVGQLNALLTTARTYAGINNITTITSNEQGTLEMCFKGGIASPTLMAGCSATTNGLPGLVPAPSAGDQEKYLRGDGTWQPAGSSSDIPDGSITTAKLADSAVTTIKVNDSAITTAKIADSNVTTAKLADAAVTAAKLDSAIDSYSLSEVATPYKWTDGKIIYKKTIECTNITSREQSFNHQISNLAQIVRIDGIYNDTDHGFQPLNRVLPAYMSSWGVGIGDISSTVFKLFIGSSYTLSHLTAYVTLWYTKSS